MGNFLSVFKGLYMSFGMFCTIPLPGYWDESGTKHMMPWFPLVGALIGFIWWGLAIGLVFLGNWVPAPLLAGVFMLIPLLFAGFIHLDGFMDTSDAILSRRSIDEKMRILKDSHTGAFAVIMVAILFIMQYAASLSVFMQETNFALLIMIPIVSRSFSALSILCIRPMNPDGYAAVFRPDSPAVHRIVTLVDLIIVFVLAWFIFGLPGLIVGGAVAVGFSVAMLCALKSFNFKGVSGDLAGFSLTIAEVCGIIAIAIIIVGGYV